jgi:predicted phosphate transport protein (TIGR00153 family)
LTIEGAVSTITYIEAAGGALPMSKFSLFPKETKVFAFFEQDAENIVKMAKQLKDMIYIWQNVKERASVLADMEQDGDAITHDIMRYLYRSFITPLDREDISSLANSLDDIADRIHAIADTAYLYGIAGPTDRAKELCDIILKAVLEVEGGVSEITSSIRQPELLKRCVTIHQIENSGDIVYRAALVDLFAYPNDIAFIVKWREVYKNMQSTLDGCEAFADILEGIAIKYA